MRAVFSLFLLSACVVGEKITTVTGPTGPVGATGEAGMSADVSRLDGLDALVQMRQVAVAFEATHGVEVVVPNPFSTLPMGFQVIDARAPDGDPMSVLQSPKLNLTRTDGTVGVTVAFDRRDTDPSATLEKSGVQSLPTGTTTPVILDVASYNTGVISVDGAKIYVSEAGLYVFHGQNDFVNNNMNGRHISWRRNGTSDERGFTRTVALTTGIHSIVSSSASFELAAGDYVEMLARQDSGGDLNLDVETRANVYRVRSKETPTGTVRGIFFGAK